MTVSREEKDHMERLMRIMNGEKPAPVQHQQLPNGQEPIVLSKQPSRADIDFMAKIMNNFNSASGNAVKQLVERSQQDTELRNALVTERVDDGIKVGAWAIKKVLRESSDGKEETVFKIQNNNDGQIIKASFLVLESAQFIIKKLNSGVPLSHSSVKEIIDLEIKYRDARQMALTEKEGWHRAKRNDNQSKMDLFEAKFDAAKHRALYFRELIRKKYHQLP